MNPPLTHQIQGKISWQFSLDEKERQPPTNQGYNQL
jgi:hypothetical protein